MSIAACYDMHLYCDVPGCTFGKFRGEQAEGEFTGDEKGSQARRRARKAGWWLSRDLSACACPGCAKLGHRPKVPL